MLLYEDGNTIGTVGRGIIEDSVIKDCINAFNNGTTFLKHIMCEEIKK